MSSPSYTLELFMEHFRSICDAVILYCVREKTQKTQAASLLLDHGNARFAALYRSTGRALSGCTIVDAKAGCRMNIWRRPV